MTFGANLEKIRKDNNVSQAKLGEVLGLTQQMISSYEKDLSSPNIDILIKIADYFHVSIDMLVGHIVQKKDADSSETRLLRYFEHLNESDREKCITIIETILNDRQIKTSKK